MSRRTILLLVILLGFALRMYGVDSKSLSDDEFNSIVEIVRLNNSQALPYFATMNLWHILGQSDFWLRFPAVFWGTLVIPLAYRIGRRVRDERSGLMLAALLALSALAIGQSQQLRFYSFFLLASSLAIFLFLNLSAHPTWRQLAAVALANLLVILAHGLGFLLPALEIACYLLTNNVQRWKARALWLGGASAVAMGIVLIPPVRAVLLDWVQSIGHGTTKTTSEVLRGVSLISFGKIAQTFYVFSFGDYQYPLDWLVVLPAALILSVLWAAGLNDLRRNPRVFVLSLLGPLSIAWLFLFLDALTPRETGVAPRYATFAVPLFFIPIAVGLANLRRSFLPVAAALLVVQGANVVALQRNEWSSTRESVVNWRQMGDWVSANAASDAIVLTADRATLPAQRYFPATLPVIADWDFHDWVAAGNLGQARQVVFVSNNWRASAAPELNARLALLQRDFYLTAALVQHPVFVYVFSRATPNANDRVVKVTLPLQVFGLEYRDLKLPIAIAYGQETISINGQFTLSAEHPTLTLPLATTRPLQQLGLVSSVTQGDGLKMGEKAAAAQLGEVAKVVVTAEDGATLTLPLRLGVETQRWDRDCAAGACAVAYTWRKKMALLGSVEYNGALQEFDAHLFGAELNLERPLEVKSIELRYLAPIGSLQIWHVSMR